MFLEVIDKACLASYIVDGGAQEHEDIYATYDNSGKSRKVIKIVFRIKYAKPTSLPHHLSEPIFETFNWQKAAILC